MAGSSNCGELNFSQLHFWKTCPINFKCQASLSEKDKKKKPNQEHICGTTRPEQMESKLSRRYQPWTRHDLICPISRNEKLWWSSRIKLKAGRTGRLVPLKIKFYNAITMHQPLVTPRRTLQLC